MPTVRITKEFKFDMAHALWQYDGLCRNIHGHTYMLEVTIKGEPIEDTDSPKLGMVMDFSDLKDIVKKPIVERFDHALVLFEKHDISLSTIPFQDNDKLIILPFQPTCENLVCYFAEIINEKLSGNLSLHKLRLNETPTSYAEWYAEDN